MQQQDTHQTAAPQIRDTGEYREARLTRGETQDRKLLWIPVPRLKAWTVADELLENQCGELKSVKNSRQTKS